MGPTVAYRVDIGTLKAPTLREDGSIVVEAHATRTGVFHYADGKGGVRREYRPAEEVAKADSLGTLKLRPFTDDHPSEKVDASTARAYAVGAVGENVRMDGDHVAVPISVWDERTVGKMRAGKTQVSCGYDVDLVEKPGIAPSGEHYDAVQTNIRYNHLALVDAGRAGTASVRMDRADGLIMVRDGAGVVLPHKGVRQGANPDDDGTDTDDAELNAEKRNKLPAKSFAAGDKLPIHDEAHVRAAMSRFGQTQFSDAAEKKAAYNKIVAKAKKLGIDTSGFEDRWSAKLDRVDRQDGANMTPEEIKALQDKAKERKDQRDAARAECATEKARADKAEAELAAAKKEIEVAKVAVAKAREDGFTAARVRLDLESRADAVVNAGLAADDAKRVKFDGLKDREVQAAVIKRVYGEDVAADKSDVYVAAYCDGAFKAADKYARADQALGAVRAAAELGVKPAPAAPLSNIDAEADAAEKMRKHSRELGRKPLAGGN